MGTLCFGRKGNETFYCDERSVQVAMLAEMERGKVAQRHYN